MRVVVCGAGAIGSAVAWFLTRRGAAVTVVERCGVACAASGKSGGFLALDWCDGSPVEALARRSFALHAELSAACGDRWGYRRLDTLSVRTSPRPRNGPVLPWLGAQADVLGQIGSTATTAQVDPARFTRGLMDAAVAGGARLVIGEVRGIARAGDRVTAVAVDDGQVEADAVVVAMGPWSVLACAWLPLPPVWGLKGNSLLLESPPGITPHALFVDVALADGSAHSPEVFPRADGTTYVCGLSGEPPLPRDPAAVTPDDGAEARLLEMAAAFSPALAGARVLAHQACYRPVARDGWPLVGRVKPLANAYVATGHSVWGMLNAPATGEALAELILDGEARTVDLRPLRPERLPPLTAA
ncbi:MAG: FAD-binding oxidoreductase [Geminicoccaceae bacterium]